MLCGSAGGKPADGGAAEMTSLGPDRPCDARPLVANSREFLCGWGAAFINISITFPINKIMFRQVGGAGAQLVSGLRADR